MEPLIIQKKIRKLANKTQAKHLSGFFKTGPGEYGAGDKFLGIKVPVLRELANDFINTSLCDLEKLINSEFHEERMLCLLIVVDRFKSAKLESEKKQFFDFYIKHKKHINNWDLIDVTSHHVVGAYLESKPKDLLYKLSHSPSLWDRRISIISTFYFIKNGQFNDSLKLARILLQDNEDLIQKAVGWMLREIGKRDICTEEQFLKVHYKKMPRTMLRYAIEKFPEKKRKAYLHGHV